MERLSDDIILVTKQDVKELVSAARTIKEMKRHGLLGVMDSEDTLDIHLEKGAFFTSFDAWECEDINDRSYNYQYKYFKIIDGVKFFCLVKERKEV